MYITFYILAFSVGNMLVYNTEAETVSANECIRLVSSILCYDHETKTVWVNRTEAVEFTKTVRECCLGYEERNGTCHPFCEKECIHGNCVSPDRCLCDAGWTGINCTEECDSNHYGHNCDENCLCENGATCNKMNGTCRCAPGFTGTYCETSCPMGSFGSHCENICQCKNGANCKVREGDEYKCLCRPGYIGKFCEMKCPDETYGKDCQNNCTCEKNSTEFCNHLNGNCNCLPGYKGKKCEKKCDAGFWGIRCENACDCGYNVTFNEDASGCNHVTGDCNCLAGWYGSKCTQKCPANRWGKGCLKECECPNNSSCDPETGECLCLQEELESNCFRLSVCSDGVDGVCNFQYNCPNDEACNNTNPNSSCVCLINGNGTKGTTNTLNLNDGNETHFPIMVVAAILIAIFILWSVVMIIGITNSKPIRNPDIEFDASSTATVIENQALPDFLSDESCTATRNEKQVLPVFSGQQFENPIYEECEVHAIPSSKSAVFLAPNRLSMKSPESAIQQNYTSKNEKKFSNEEDFFSFKGRTAEKEFSANAVALYSSSRDNQETTDEKSDKVSLYRISIYEDARNLEEHHYEN